MAIIAPTQPDPKSTLLTTLLSIRAAHSTRHELSAELELALSSYLSSPPSTSHTATSPGSTSADADADAEVEVEAAVRPPNEAELSEILRIAFEGLLSVRTEISVLREVLKDVWAREDLEKVVGEVERLEGERLKETLKRDQLRRLAVLDVEADFDDAIAQSETRRKALAMQINEELQEFSAEIAELSASEEV